MKKKTYEYLTFYSPSFVYIPYDNIENLSIRKDKKIYNNSIIGTRKDNSNIFSDVSGVLAGSMKMNYLSGHSESLIIENDFMDRKKVLNPYKDISSLNKNEINDLLIKHGLYKRLNSKSTLIVNSTYNSKNDIGDMFINYESYDEILETIDEILNVYNIKVCYIVVPHEDFVSIDAYNKYINAFDNICIVHSNKKFNDKSCVFYDVEDIMAAGKAIHQDSFFDSTMISIISDNNKVAIKTKVYSSLTEVLDTFKIKYKNKSVYINGNMYSDINDFVITRDVKIIEVK